MNNSKKKHRERKKLVCSFFYLFTACNQFVNKLCLPVLRFLDILFKLPDLYTFEKMENKIKIGMD